MSAVDHVVRAMTDDGSFRLVAVRATDTVAAALTAQEARGADAVHLGELLAGAVLYRETMAPNLQVQCIVQGAGRSGHLTADSHPDGWARGLVQHGRGASEVRVDGGGALLQMLRTLPTGQIHRGVVTVPADRGISGGLMGYMDASEQVLSMVSVASVLEGERTVAAGGYLLQLLPEARDHEGLLALLTERLRDFEDIEARVRATDASPEHLVEEIFYGLDFTWLHRSPVRFGCNCSRARVMGSLAALSAADLASLMADAEPLDMSCNYCGARYIVELPELAGLLDHS